MDTYMTIIHNILYYKIIVVHVLFIYNSIAWDIIVMDLEQSRI